MIPASLTQKNDHISLAGFNPEVISIGAGPVGLCEAIEQALLAIKHNVPPRHHLMIEKHEVYQRLHVVILQDRAFTRYIRHPMFDPIMERFKKEKNVPTSDIENEFMAIAKQLNIRFLYENIAEPQTLPARFPTARVIIGSGGSRGIIRTKIFQDQMRRNIDLAYACEIKYRVKGKATAFSAVDTYRMMKGVGTIVDERCGRMKEGTSPITTRFFITKEEYQQLVDQGVTFAKPFTMKDLDKISEKLRENIVHWLQVRRKEKEDQIPIVDSEKITVAKLAFYSSRIFAKKDEKYDVTWVIVGDEACGAPLFTSLNNGFESAHELAHAVDRYFRKASPPLIDFRRSIDKDSACEGDDLDNNFVQYASFQYRHTELHYGEIMAKIGLLNAGKYVVAMNSMMPWSFFKPM